MFALQSAWRSLSSVAPELKKTAPCCPAFAALRRLSALTSITINEIPLLENFCTAAAGSSLPFSMISLSAKDWLRNLPGVLLSSIARCAPARPAFDCGISRSGIVDIFSVVPRYPILTSSVSAGALGDTARNNKIARRIARTTPSLLSFTVRLLQRSRRPCCRSAKPNTVTVGWAAWFWKQAPQTLLRHRQYLHPHEATVRKKIECRNSN